MAPSGFAGHVSANEPGAFATAAVPCDFQPLVERLRPGTKAVDRLGRRTVTEKVFVTVRENHDVAGLQLFALPAAESGAGVPRSGSGR